MPLSSILDSPSVDDVPQLIEALKVDDHHIRHAAATALAKLGPQAKEAVPALIDALGNYDEGSGITTVKWNNQVVPFKANDE